jgi:hypothetical protein
MCFGARHFQVYPADSCREGSVDQMGWSPNWLLRRLIGPSLVNYNGPHVSDYRAAYIREFNSTVSLAKHFHCIRKLAKAHVGFLMGEQTTAEINDIVHQVELYAIALWGDLLYKSPNYQADGQVWKLSTALLAFTTDPWPSFWYSVYMFLRLVRPGEPLRSEAKLRTQLQVVVERSIEKMEEFERENPDAPPTSVRSLSMMTGGGKRGPLSTTATEFARLNTFGMCYDPLVKNSANENSWQPHIWL